MKPADLTPSQTGALAQAATTLGISPDWLFAAIDHESGWNPSIKNPLSSAQGLLQWIDSTSQGLGYDDTADLIAQNPTVEQQLLGPVVDYLKPYTPITSVDQLAAVIFYPAYKDKLDTPLPAAVQKANPGIVTLRDYASKYLVIPTGAEIGGGLVVVLLVGAVAWWYFAKH